MSIKLRFPPTHSFPAQLSALRYGTAGFRMRSGDVLRHVVQLMGLLASMRSKSFAAAVPLRVGVMLTASHNPKCDNGVKIVEPSGEMLKPAWESTAEKLVACSRNDELEAVVESVLASREHFPETPASIHDVPSVVVIGHDSRDSSPELFKALKAGLGMLGSTRVVDIGLCTTPVLHYLVYLMNKGGGEDVTVDQYYKALSEPFVEMMNASGKPAVPFKIAVDCACAVGGLSVKEIARYIPEDVAVLTPFNLYTDHPEFLNDGCGTDHIVTKRQFPRHFEECVVGELGQTSCGSFDGDADRVVLIYKSDKKGETPLQLLDGDKITSLFMLFLSQQLGALGLTDTLSCGAVQTAYANGASTAYLRSVLPDGGAKSLGLAKTGVKYVHHEAQSYDIGVYFEANGHGTALFSQKAREVLFDPAMDKKIPDDKKIHLKLLRTFARVINPAVGDALSDLLAIIGVLHNLKLDLVQWNSLYTNLPSVLRKSKVPDRTLIKTNATETKVLEPAALQKGIDAAVEATGDQSARSFVRPSGTEDVVRIYAEATTLDAAGKLADAVCAVVDEVLCPKS